MVKIVGDEAWERSTRKGWTKDNFEDFQQKPQQWRAELLKRIRSWSAQQAKTIIVPSQYLARWVTRWGIPSERIQVVYNALEPPSKVEPIPVPLSTPLKAITVGRLIALKRIDKVIEAVSQLPEIGLIIVGDGPERAVLESITLSLGVSDRVYFAGARSKEDTLRLMAASNMFVLNSVHEGFPFVILEAMSIGLPVVATAVGGYS